MDILNEINGVLGGGKPAKARKGKGKKRLGWRVTIHAKPGAFLMGGVRSFTSSTFPTKQDAKNYAAAMMDQPNAASATYSRAPIDRKMKALLKLSRGGKRRHAPASPKAARKRAAKKAAATRARNHRQHVAAGKKGAKVAQRNAAKRSASARKAARTRAKG